MLLFASKDALTSGGRALTYVNSRVHVQLACWCPIEDAIDDGALISPVGRAKSHTLEQRQAVRCVNCDRPNFKRRKRRERPKALSLYDYTPEGLTRLRR